MTNSLFPPNEVDRANRIFVGQSSQVLLTVRGKHIFRELQERVLKWGFDPKRNLKGIPESAWLGETFEIDSDHSERASGIKLTDPNYWAFRLSERLKDTNRIWTTEVGIAEVAENEVVFGCRLICSQRGMSEPIPRSIPSFVRGIAFTQDSRLDGRQTSADPWIVNDQKSVDQLIAFIRDLNRNHPIVVFSLPEGSENPELTIIPVRPFVRRTVGYVHTFVISSAASFILTDILGREFSVYRQAIRTFLPGFNSDDSLPSEHPLATAARIQTWDDGHDEKFDDFLVQQALRPTRPRDVIEREHPPFEQVKRIAAERTRRSAQASGQSDAEMVSLFELELQAAKQEAQSSLELAIAADAEREQAIADLQQTKASYIALQARLTSLKTKIEQGASSDVSIPSTFDEMEIWATENLSGDVTLHGRAIKAIRASTFQNTDLVYNALLMMRDLYVRMRREGGIDLKNAFDLRLAELGLENTKCFTQENKAKSFGGEYFVTYQGDRRELDWHLKGSNSRDGRLAFRMYYFWDVETSQVVVGYLPGHLQNDIS